jgi:hypothetical protein
VIPTCLAIVLCQRVERDTPSGNPDAVGVFTAFYVESFPTSSAPLTVWVRLVGGRGRLRFVLTFEWARKGSLEFAKITSIPFTIAFRHASTVHEYVARFRNGLQLADEGEYRVTLSLGDRMLMQDHFIATYVLDEEGR